MKNLLILAVLASTVVFAGCERKETVVLPTTETPSTIIVPVPGPKGDTGASGASGATGATGAAGSTTIVTPPAAAPAEAPK